SRHCLTELDRLRRNGDMGARWHDVAQALGKGRKESRRFIRGLVHFPVGDKERGSHTVPRRGTSTAFSPGSSFPSKNSRVAPPPVLMKSKRSWQPAASIAAAESPPPAILRAVDPAIIRAISKVPCANAGVSKTPIGP